MGMPAVGMQVESRNEVAGSPVSLGGLVVFIDNSVVKKGQPPVVQCTLDSGSYFLRTRKASSPRREEQDNGTIRRPMKGCWQAQRRPQVNSSGVEDIGSYPIRRSERFRDVPC